MYGLESTVFNQVTLRRLDAFQLKGLRQILNSYGTTNHYLFSRAAHYLEADLDSPLIQPLSKYHEKQRHILFARLIITREHEPSSRMTFQTDSLLPQEMGTRRVGRPRLNWYQETLKSFWQEAKTYHNSEGLGTLNLHTQQHFNMLIALSQDYDRRYKFRPPLPDPIFDDNFIYAESSPSTSPARSPSPPNQQ